MVLDLAAEGLNVKYLGSKFTVPLGGDAFAEGWERIFGKKWPPASAPREAWKSHPPCPRCGADRTLVLSDPVQYECPECETRRPQSLETPDLTLAPSMLCAHGGRPRDWHYRYQGIWGSDILSCRHVEFDGEVIELHEQFKPVSG